MEQITTVGIDLAKNVFSLHGVDGAGRLVLRRTLRRDLLVATVAALPPCRIGMEACSGAPQCCASTRSDARAMPIIFSRHSGLRGRIDFPFGSTGGRRCRSPAT